MAAATQLQLHTLSQDEKLMNKKASFLKWRKSVLTNLLRALFEEESLSITVLDKSNRYDFEKIDFTYFNNTPVYVLKFEPSGSADYAGKLYIDADEMTLIRAEYKNIQNIPINKLCSEGYRFIKFIINPYILSNKFKFTKLLYRRVRIKINNAIK